MLITDLGKLSLINMAINHTAEEFKKGNLLSPGKNRQLLRLFQADGFEF